MSSFNWRFNMIWFSCINIKNTFFVEHVFHTIFIFLIGLVSQLDQDVNLPTVLLVPFMNGIEWLVYFFCDFRLTLNNLKFWDHFLNSFNSLLIVGELFFIEFFVNICGYLAIHCFLHLNKKIRWANSTGTLLWTFHLLLWIKRS